MGLHLPTLYNFDFDYPAFFLDLKTRLFVISGKPERDVADVVDVRYGLNCGQEIGYERYGAVGGLINGHHVVICGGRLTKPSTYFNNCLTKNLIDGNETEIEMSSGRMKAASIHINESTLWIVGGYNKSLSYNTTEFIDLENGSSIGPQLPFALYGHCMVYLNESAVFISGGSLDYKITNKSWISNPKDEFKFLPIAPMIKSRRYHSCAKFINENGKVMIMVAGGEDEYRNKLETTEIFDSGTNKWQSGV